jgi:hypothetical protein
MIRKKVIPEEDSSFPLLRLLNAGFPERYEIAERIAGRANRTSLSTRFNPFFASEFDYYALTGRWPSGPRIFVFPRLCWERLMRWTPTGPQLRNMAAWLECLGTMAETALKLAIVGAGLYVLGEVIWAFMPGGAAWRFLEGVR